MDGVDYRIEPSKLLAENNINSEVSRFELQLGAANFA